MAHHPYLLVIIRVWALLYFNRVQDAKQLLSGTLQAAGVSQVDAMQIARDNNQQERIHEEAKETE